ncbi:MAG TPA: SpvB/TcaC N-terminal domain-containing protein [Acidimicrobiales bacterium]|nr:SpvB/TcaC N-terminal domain-containing protein [Acidimicrobiales bacterium]
MTEQSSAELISLPTGGGALKGLGETFQPDLHTGTGNYRVPLDTPPGRNGLQPQLALSYSTGNGNGPFGLGWSLPVPGVRRKTAKTIPQYAGGDVFVLSGAEDLVPVGGDPGERRFRPRGEAPFARILHHTALGQDYWAVWSKDGLGSHYGTERPGDAPEQWRDPAVISDPENPRRILGWLLTETVDPAGNRILYTYRGDGESSQRYLSEIRYVDHGERANPQFLVSIRFVYERRPDPFTDRRGGFEVRTTLRCSRIETWIRADAPVLVRSVTLRYADQEGRAAANGMSLLSRVVVTGHEGDRTERLPSLEFGYTTWEPKRRRYQPFSAPGGEVPPTSLRPGDSDLVDLFGDGLPGVLQMNGASRYWRNRGGAAFDAPRRVRSVPADASLGQPGVQLADMDGDGRMDLLVTSGTRAGFYPVDHNGGFAPDYVAYRRAPAVNLADPEVRLIDLDGDGAVDAVRTGTSLQLYYNDSRGSRQWSAAVVRPRRDTFPVSFSDPRVKLADMSGDGLTDVVLIHDGRVDYWPNGGFGRWGPVVTMANAPRWMDAAAGPGGYDPQRLLVGDVDGDGCADLVYVGDGEATVWLNRSGFSFSEPIVIRGTPTLGNTASVRLADMLGTGTTGILWTYDAGTQRESTYKFLDLTGGVKPYLLSSIDNHMGARTRIEYAPSTRYALADAHAGRPWRTTLPFPVQVVARTTVTEHFSASRMTSEFRYHHGYWDGDEREFRGFAHVDQLDAETFEDVGAPRRHAPPTETRTWFHMGPVRGSGSWEPLDLSDEYWDSDGSLLGRTDTGWLLELPPRAQRDALRSLAGRILRTEVYGRDGDPAHQDRPYTVTEHRYGVAAVVDGRTTADAGWQARPVFFPHVLAERTTRWERGEDPMTTAVFTAGYDNYGRPGQTVDVAVPRGRDPRLPAAPGAAHLATTTVVHYATRDDPTRYFADRVARTDRYELVNDGSLTLNQLRAGALDGSIARRLLGSELIHYDGPAFEGLEVGQLGDHGTPVRTELLAFTSDMLTDLCPTGPPPYLNSPPATWPREYPVAFRNAMASGAGYAWREAGTGYVAGYYVESRRVRLDFHDDPAGGRGLTVAQRDPLGNETTITYDRYRLLAVGVTDAAGLTTTADHDYRVLLPRMLTDANGNRQRVGYTPLGLVAWTAHMGKDGREEGDTEAQPGTRHEYGLGAWDDSSPSERQPVWAHTTRRVDYRWDTVRAENERRAAMGLPPMTDAEIAGLFPPDERERFQERFLRTQEYSDGLGRLLQSRVQWDTVVVDDLGLPSSVDIAPSDAVAREQTDPTAPSVAVSGWKAYDNKGRVVQAWEPYLGAGWSYRPPSDQALDQLVSTVTHYDPRGTPVRVVHPDGSEDRTVLGIPPDLAIPALFTPSPWEVYQYDPNDNAGRTHAITASDWTSHWNTPTSTEIDALGRTVETTARTASERHATNNRYDVEGRLLETWDALGRRVSRSVYDLLGRKWVNHLLDAAGTRLVLDAAGAVVERRDDKGALTLTQYDRLRRPLRYWARDGAGEPVTLRGLTLYGDDAASGLTPGAAAASNLLGRPYQTYDEAGLLTAVRFDFAGNLLERQRQVLKTSVLQSGLPRPGGEWSGRWYKVDWQPPRGKTLQQHAGSMLDPNAYQTSNRHDALGRRSMVMLPVDVSAKRRTMRFSYSRSGHLQSVDADGSSFVRRILYNPRGQRTLAVLGNGLMVRYAYDPATFRLARLRSERFTQVAPLRWRSSSTDGVRQDHGYRHDLVGNLLELRDRTPGCGIPPGDRDRLDRAFHYDELYRLVFANGRECKLAPASPWSPEARCHDLTATQVYKETYTYDRVGNLLRLVHNAGTVNWTSQATMIPGGNCLQAWSGANGSLNYGYDACGNVVQETNSRLYEWDAANRLSTFRVQAQGADPSLYVQYRYDSIGQRVLKVVRDQGGKLATSIYIDGLFERLLLTGPSTTHDTVYVMDDAAHVASVRVGAPRPGEATPATLYQLLDHLGSSEAVTDASGALVNREEFSPYGQTTFGSYARKRYRFTGKERDQETGLTYHGARYYAPWLARWMSCDPAGLSDGVNQYAYVRNRPTTLVDRQGALASEARAVTGAATIARAGVAGAGGAVGGGGAAASGALPLMLVGAAAVFATVMTVLAVQAVREWRQQVALADQARQRLAETQQQLDQQVDLMWKNGTISYDQLLLYRATGNIPGITEPDNTSAIVKSTAAPAPSVSLPGAATQPSPQPQRARVPHSSGRPLTIRDYRVGGAANQSLLVEGLRRTGVSAVHEEVYVRDAAGNVMWSPQARRLDIVAIDIEGAKPIELTTPQQAGSAAKQKQVAADWEHAKQSPNRSLEIDGVLHPMVEDPGYGYGYSILPPISNLKN